MEQKIHGLELQRAEDSLKIVKYEARLEGLQIELEKFKTDKRKQDELLIVRQIATNIEYEYKVECIRMKKDLQDTSTYKDKRGNVHLKHTNGMKLEKCPFEIFLNC